MFNTHLPHSQFALGWPMGVAPGLPMELKHADYMFQEVVHLGANQCFFQLKGSILYINIINILIAYFGLSNWRSLLS